eukprot:g3393.t1
MVTAARLRKNRKRSSSLKRDRGRSAVDKDLKAAQHPASAVDESVVPLIEDVTVFGDGDTGYQDGIDEAVAAAEAASSSAEAAKAARSENTECSPAQESTVASRCQAALAGAATDAGAAAQLTAAAEDLTAAGAPTAGNEKPTALQTAPTDPTAVAAAVKLPKEHYTRSKKCREFVDGFLRKLLAPLNAHQQANGGKAGQQRGSQSNFRRLHPRFGAFSAAGNISNIELGPERDIVKLLKYAHAIVADQPMFLELEAPINVMGDIHGQYGDLLEHFKKCGFPPRANYLLLGDYVDRGQQSLETMCLLMCYKIKYPENFFILRGNHECAYISKLYGFHDECKRKYSVKLWREFTMFFKWLPVAATVGGKIFCAHGGLSTEFFTERDGVFNPTKGKKGKGKRGGKNGGGKNGAGKQGSGKGADANQLEDWEMESSSSSGESEDEDAKKAAENTAAAEKQKDLDGAAAADTSSKSSRSPTTSENEPSEATPVAHSDGSDSDESEAEREEAQRTLELVCQNATAAELAKALQLREAAGLLDDENEGNAGGEKSQNVVGDVLIGEFSAEPGSDDDDDPVSVAGFTQVWPTSPISSSDSSASPSSSRASSEDSNRSRSGVRKKKSSSSSVAGAGGTKKKSSSKKRRRRLSSERSKQSGSDRKANKSPRKILEEHLRKLLADADEGKKDASVNQGAEESRDEGVKKRKSSMKKQSSAKKKGADGDKDKDKGPAEEISPSSKEELEQLDEDPDAEAPLPPDWERVSSEIVSSFGYYRNKKTGEVTQERPKPVPLVDDAGAGAGPSSAAGAGPGAAAGVVRREEETSGKVSCLSNRHENASERKLIEAVRDWVSASKPTKHQIALALEHLRLTRNVSLQDVRAAFKAAQAAEAREKPDAANQNPFLAAALSAGSAAKNAKSSKRKKGGNGNAAGDDGAPATRGDLADHNKRSIPSELKRQLPKIPRSKIRSLMQAKLPQRPVEIPEAGLMCDLLWSDPCPSTAFWRPNERGVSFAFGAKVVESFCKKFNIDLVCRAHQAIADGYWFFAQKRLVTVFSAPDYCGEMRNDAAILQVDTKLHCKFKVLQSSHKVMGMKRQGFGNMGGGVLGSPGRGALAMVSNNAGGARGVLGGGLLGGMNGVGRAAGAGQQEDRIVDLEKLIATGVMDWVQPGAAEDSAPASSESSDAGAPAAKKRKKA